MSAWTFAFQVVNFVILALVLRRFLFKPVTAMIAHRQGVIEAATKDAEAMKRTAEESRARYDGELDTMRAERESRLGELRALVAQEGEKALGQAHAEGAAILASARADIAQERAAAAAGLTDAAVILAVDLAKRLLEQAAGAGIAETLLQRACVYLESLPIERLRSLREELGSGAASLEVATSPALAAEAEVLWAQRIVKNLDTRSTVRFVADEALVAGAELRFPHTKISFCWRDGLDAARKELAHHADDP